MYVNGERKLMLSICNTFTRRTYRQLSGTLQIAHWKERLHMDSCIIYINNSDTLEYTMKK